MASIVYSQARKIIIGRLMNATYVTPPYKATCDRCGVEWEEGDPHFSAEEQFTVDQIIGTIERNTHVLCKDCDYEVALEILNSYPPTAPVGRRP